MGMKKKETLWQLLKRLDKEAGQFNIQLSGANRYFDTEANKTRTLLEKHKKDLHKTIGKFRKALKSFIKKQDKKSIRKK
jgi:hypothetical protein